MGTNYLKADLLTVKDIVSLLAEDAKTGKNTAELARRMGMQPSALQNALSRGSIPFRGVFNYCKTETKPMEYFLTGYDPFDQEEFNRRIIKMQLEKEKLEHELEMIKAERDRLLSVISGEFIKNK